MSATVVSFVPWAMRETKPGIIPDEYIIPARGTDKKLPAVLIVKDATSNLYMGFDRAPYPAPEPATNLARSIVEDAAKGLIEADSEVGPGVFWVEGIFTAKEIADKFPIDCARAITKQNQWFLRLVKNADDSWTRFKQHKLITDLQRHAAHELGLNGKEWAMTPEPITLIKCPACKTMVESDAIVCQNCRAILKTEEAKKLGIVFATT